MRIVTGRQAVGPSAMMGVHFCLHQPHPPIRNLTPMLPFFVVGVGASAGGLEAFSELLAEIPLTSGLAFLLIQHQDPRHKSPLVQILAEHTIIPVIQADHGQFIESNCVYIIPPNTLMTLCNGELVLTARKDFPAPAMPIDRLFQSLAEEQGNQSIGVILSGTGSDGAQGLRAIKNAGGTTYVQNEDSAQFHGMPKAAMELGVVDRVLPPSAIASALLQSAKRLQARNERTSLEDEFQNFDTENFRLLFQHLKQATDVDFTHYKRGTVQRRLSRRMLLSGMTDLTEYLKRLECNPQETLALFGDLLIQVTDFFRDHGMFDGLSRIVFPKLMENRSPDNPIRFWIPGCASGEEVYSIAICLMDYLGERTDHPRIQLFGTDISDAAIEKARTGIFSANIAHQVSTSRLEKYFTAVDNHYQINRKIRDLCIFARHDLVRDPPFSRIDIISCRNLLIYLDTTLQKRVIPRFHYALRPVGFLVLGESEGISACAELFSAVDGRFGIFCKTQLVERNPLAFMEEYPVQTERTTPKKIAISDDISEPERLQQEADRLALDRYVPPGVLCDSDMNILRFRGETTPFLTNPSGRPSLKLKKLVRPGMLVELGSAFEEARLEKRIVRRENLHLKETTGIRIVNLEVIPLLLPPSQSPWFLVFFEDKGVISPVDQRHQANRFLSAFWQKTTRKASILDTRDEHIARLGRDIEAARDYIRAMQVQHEQAQEDLKATEQELLSSNEEFQSTNEELETAQEELQASNDELRARNRRLKELNEDLQQACGFAEAIVETIHHPLLVLDGGLRVIRANQTYYDQFQTTAELTERRGFYEICQRCWDLAELRFMLEDIFSTDSAFLSREITQTFPEIGTRTLTLNAKILQSNDHPPLILLAIEDITEHKSALEALQSVNQKKDEFLAMLAHELRNPLAPIRNALEIWRRNTDDQELVLQAQAMLDRQLKQETRLLDDLLDMSRVSRGIITLKKQILDLTPWIGGIVSDFYPEFEAHKQQFILDLPACPLWVEADPARLQQVILNLLTNAIKYTPVGGQISLSVCRDNQYAVISVKDNGIGISPNLLPTIFDLFVQADKSLARLQGGLGLGLTLAYRLIELHKGEISVYSEGLGKGSVFSVRLPALPESSLPKAVNPSHTPLEEPKQSRRILVVDDNVDSAEGTAILLQMEGHQVKTAFDGFAALELITEFNPDVVLLDIGLAGLDGYEVAVRLRKFALAKQPYLIAMTGYGQASDRAKALEHGFDEHLVKPVEIDYILRLISKH
ncbi:MAG: chemotaxis protein CheB [Methylococcaceae bacterium]